MTIQTRTLVGRRLGGSYQLQELIGHGNYSTVWRATRTGRREEYAVKVIPKAAPNASPIEKELLLHRSLSYPNIVRVVQVFEDAESVYLVQELCSGGELFERIEPDVGFPPAVAHFYFVQLLEAVEYLHARGVAHRDIKPENLLLDERGNLKLTDFGLATLFKKGDRRRNLQTRCGTPLYMAPEVMAGCAYQGDEADLWSCAVVLFVMLLGCHPWEEPTARCNFYKKFVIMRASHDYAPWNRLDAACRDLLERMLGEDAGDRLTLKQVLAHPWTRQPNELLDAHHQCADPGLLSRSLQPAVPTVSVPSGIFALTQPQVQSEAASLAATAAAAASRPGRRAAFAGFSQPTGNGELPPTGPAVNEEIFSSRLTRFYCQIACAEILQCMEQILDRFLITWKQLPTPNSISFSTVDRRKNPLAGEIMAISISDDRTMVVFTKGRGDGLEFKRLFNMVYSALQSAGEV